MQIYTVHRLLRTVLGGHKIMLIPRITDIDHFGEMEDEFQSQFGIRPFNVSSWHISTQFRDTMLENMEFPAFGNAIEYYYTYNLPRDIRAAVLKKLGTEDPHTVITLAPNNTISIVNVVNLLRLCGRKNICIVDPSYFSIRQVLTAMGLPYRTEGMLHIGGQYHLPADRILSGDYDTVWLTSPVFSTGVYLSDEDLSFIKSLLDRGLLVVADESFALHGHELIRRIGGHPNFIGIYSPHKAIACNGFKFSAIVSGEEYEEPLEQWVDVLGGNLPQSTCGSILHFLSENYAVCLNTFQTLIADARNSVFPLLQGERHHTDETAIGSMLTIYFEHIPSEAVDDTFFHNLYHKTFASFLPGTLNGFDPRQGLCFRVNLALDCLEFRQALQRLLPYLDSL